MSKPRRSVARLGSFGCTFIAQTSQCIPRASWMANSDDQPWFDTRTFFFQSRVTQVGVKFYQRLLHPLKILFQRPSCSATDQSRCSSSSVGACSRPSDSSRRSSLVISMSSTPSSSAKRHSNHFFQLMSKCAPERSVCLLPRPGRPPCHTHLAV